MILLIIGFQRFENPLYLNFENAPLMVTPPKTNMEPKKTQKMEVWKMIFLFNRVIFRFYVSFQGCICFIKKMIIQLSRKEDRILQPLKCHRSFLRDLAMDTTSMTFVEKSQGFRGIKNGSFLLYIFSRCTPLPQRCMGRKGTWSYVQIHTGDVHVPSFFGNRHYSMYQAPEKRRHHAWDCQMVEIWTKLKLFFGGDI